jgi:hypothetical protein
VDLAATFPGKRLANDKRGERGYRYTYVGKEEDAVVAAVEERMAAVTHLPAHGAESRLMVTEYLALPRAHPYFPVNNIHVDIDVKPDRIATFVLYLNDVAPHAGAAQCLPLLTVPLYTHAHKNTEIPRHRDTEMSMDRGTEGAAVAERCAVQGARHYSRCCTLQTVGWANGARGCGRRKSPTRRRSTSMGSNGEGGPGSPTPGTHP